MNESFTSPDAVKESFTPPKAWARRSRIGVAGPAAHDVMNESFTSPDAVKESFMTAGPGITAHS